MRERREIRSMYAQCCVERFFPLREYTLRMLHGVKAPVSQEGSFRVTDVAPLICVASSWDAI